LIIDTTQATIASKLQEAGYATGVVGKWHLGLGGAEGPDWNGEIRPGPLELGFDESFLIPATGDRVPTVFVDGHRVAGLDPADPIAVSYGEPIGDEPTGREHPEMLRMGLTQGHDNTIVNGISRIGYMSGGRSARWIDEDIADVLTARAVEFIERHRDDPFFLYFSTHDIHVPRVPNERFAGVSGLGPRGDVILQLDWAVGEILSTIELLGLEENTLIVFTSDNGPVLDDGYADQAVELLGDHEPWGPFRGGKYSIFEAGTRVPFIVRWPGAVPPGTTDALISQVDLMATFGALTGVELTDGEGPDSFNLLPDLLGRGAILAVSDSLADPFDVAGGPTFSVGVNATADPRDDLIEHNGSQAVSIVRGNWKYIEPNNGRAYDPNVDIELGNSSEPQLYRLSDDLGERRNLATDYPEVVAEMAALLDRYRAAGRTRGTDESRSSVE
jgi:arylsulfatase A-like enzyme